MWCSASELSVVVAQEPPPEHRRMTSSKFVFPGFVQGAFGCLGSSDAWKRRRTKILLVSASVEGKSSEQAPMVQGIKMLFQLVSPDQSRYLGLREL